MSEIRLPEDPEWPEEQERRVSPPRRSHDRLIALEVHRLYSARLAEMTNEEVRQISERLEEQIEHMGRVLKDVEFLNELAKDRKSSERALFIGVALAVVSAILNLGFSLLSK